MLVMTMTADDGNHVLFSVRPVEGGGKFSRAPRRLGGGRRRSKILKMVFQVASF